MTTGCSVRLACGELSVRGRAVMSGLPYTVSASSASMSCPSALRGACGAVHGVLLVHAVWWMTHKMGGKGGHDSHERQLLLVESKAGAGVLSGEKDDPSCVSGVPPARGVRVSGQPRGWRPRQRRASALCPELRCRHACRLFVPLDRRWFPSVYGDGVASSAPLMWSRFGVVSRSRVGPLHRSCHFPSALRSLFGLLARFS